MPTASVQAASEDYAQLKAKAVECARRGDHTGAWQRWEDIRSRFPGDIDAHVGAVGALRELGRLDEAERVLSEAAERFADSPQIAWERARLASARRDWPEAARRWEAVRAQFPERPIAYVNGAAALRELGRHDEAERLLAEAAGKHPDNASIALERARLATARRDWRLALARWNLVQERFPKEIAAYIGALDALRELGRSAEAEALLAAAEPALLQARAAGSGGEAADRLEKAIARVRKDWSTIRRIDEKLIAEQVRPPAALFTELAGACWELRDLDGAERAASRAIALDPNQTFAALIMGWIATEAGDGEKALAHFRALAQVAPDNQSWAFECARLLNFLGRVDEAAAEFDRVRTRWPDDPHINVWMLNHGLREPALKGGGEGSGAFTLAYVEQELRQITGLAPTDAELSRPIIDDDRDRDVIVGEHKGADTVVIIFTGTHDHLTVPLSIFDRYLAAFGASAVYLKDFHRLMYRSGVRSLGDRDSTLAALREIATRLGARRLCTIGVEAGAAIGYGARLGADRIVGFAVQTTAKLAPGTSLPVGNLMRKQFQTRGYGSLGLRGLLEQRPYSAKIELFYAEGTPDQAHAEHLSGLPGVTLHPQTGTKEHAVLRWMAQRADFGPTLAAMLGFER